MHVLARTGAADELIKLAADVILSAVEVVTLILSVSADLLSWLCLLRFAPELVLASAVYGLFAEAAI